MNLKAVWLYLAHVLTLISSCLPTLLNHFFKYMGMLILSPRNYLSAVSVGARRVRMTEPLQSVVYQRKPRQTAIILVFLFCTFSSLVNLVRLTICFLQVPCYSIVLQ